MRILFCRSNPIAPDPRVEKEARALAGVGYSVCVLGWDRTAALPPHEKHHGWEIIRLPIPAKYGQGLGNLPALLRWQYKLWQWLFVHHREYDVIHACDFDTIFPALLAKLFFRKQVVYDIFDFYADHLRRTPKWIKTLIRWLDLWAASLADALILVDDARREQVQRAHPRHIEIIYNSPEEGSLPSSSTLGSFRLAYVGLLQVERGLFDVIEVMRRHPDWHLDLAGFGGDEKILLEAVHSLSNISWHGRISYEEAIRLNALAEVLFATYDPAIPNHRYSSPNKLFEAMMLGKPIVVARGTNMDTIVQKYNCGLVIEYGNIEMLDAAFQRLADEPELRYQLGANGRRAYETTYSWDLMRQRLLRLYTTVLKQPDT